MSLTQEEINDTLTILTGLHDCPRCANRAALPLARTKAAVDALLREAQALEKGPESPSEAPRTDEGGPEHG